MSKFFILKKADEVAAREHAQFLLLLPKINPKIQVEAAAIVTVPDELDCLILSMDGVSIAGQAPATIQASVSIPTSEKLVKAKRGRKPQATGICSQCGKDRPLTKTGICKPCAMNNARAARKNGREIVAGHVGTAEKRINRAANAEPRIITRHGPIKGKKLA